MNIILRKLNYTPKLTFLLFFVDCLALVGVRGWGQTTYTWKQTREAGQPQQTGTPTRTNWQQQNTSLINGLQR